MIPAIAVAALVLRQLATDRRDRRDAEQRRLERNLHDGAQQRLLSVALGLRLVETRLAAYPDEAEPVESSWLELDRRCRIGTTSAASVMPVGQLPGPG